MNTQIPVTVNVVTYNSSKFVLETLDSIKAQTYLPLILQICDDYSTDDTIKICKKWIKENKDRFIKTKVIIPDHNTGISANINRGMDACETEWFKGIAGDDILKPICIETYVQYVTEHPESVVVFSRVELFNTTQIIESSFDRDFDAFSADLSPQEWYNRLITKGNPIPAPSSFKNVKRFRELGVKADERIPLLEDYPMWINLSLKGVRFHFIDEVLVKYRVGSGGLSSGGNISINYRKSLRLFYFYYLFPEKYRENPEKEINDIVKWELDILQDIQSIQKSPSYKLGDTLLRPIKWLLGRK